MRSLKLIEESGHQVELAKTKLEIGRYYLQLGNKSKARENVIAAAKIFYPIDEGLIPDDLKYLIKDLRVEENLLEEIFNLGQEAVAIRDTKELLHHIFSTVNKITGLVVSNTTASAVAATVGVGNNATYGSATVIGYIAYQISVPANASLIVVDKTTDLYITENQSVGVVSGTGSALTFTAIFEAIT